MFVLAKTYRDLELRYELLRKMTADAVAERDYWRDKAEKLLDSALLRKGEVGSPVFQKTPPRVEGPFKGILSALNVHEIESKPSAEPMTPMK